MCASRKTLLLKISLRDTKSPLNWTTEFLHIQSSIHVVFHVARNCVAARNENSSRPVVSQSPSQNVYCLSQSPVTLNRQPLRMLIASDQRAVRIRFNEAIRQPRHICYSVPDNPGTATLQQEQDLKTI